MKFEFAILFTMLFVSTANGQSREFEWYSESVTNGVIIQNSFPKGGSYSGQVKDKFNDSYLIFFTRITNETEKSIDFSICFPADSIAIPNSAGTFMKLILPQDTMTMDKLNSFNYGIKQLKLLGNPTTILKRLKPKEDLLVYIGAYFFQTSKDDWRHERGGNRAELLLDGQDLFFKMIPQVDNLHCGSIIFDY